MVVLKPVVSPLTIPVRAPTVPARTVLLLHAPPGTVSLSVIVPPAQTADGPVIAPGEELTVTTWVAIHPAADR